MAGSGTSLVVNKPLRLFSGMGEQQPLEDISPTQVGAQFSPLVTAWCHHVLWWTLSPVSVLSIHQKRTPSDPGWDDICEGGCGVTVAVAGPSDLADSSSSAFLS